MSPDTLIQLVVQYKYLIMTPAAMVLGPTVSLVAGILLRLDVISLVPTCLALAVGELSGDMVWYWLGRRFGERFILRFGRYVGITPTSVGTVKELFNQQHDIILFTSKLTAGFGFAIPVLFTAGLSKVPFRRYMMLNIAGQFLWTAGMLSIGYFLGHLYLRVGNVFEKMALAALILLVILALIGFGKYLRNI